VDLVAWRALPGAPGARHLKRAIERLLVQPMSNLIATEQVRGGDWIRVDYDDSATNLRFAKEAEGLPVQDMFRLVDTSITVPAGKFSSGTAAETPLRSGRRWSSKSSPDFSQAVAERRIGGVVLM
jgi:hypothetical protein